MDRNKRNRPSVGSSAAVALRKESVDRNTSIDNLTQGVFKSLSARRAWIEISEDWLNAGSLSVALRKESVDRNGVSLNYKEVLYVALRKESVDRNMGMI